MSNIYPYLIGVESSLFINSEWRSKEIWLVSDDGL